MAFSRGRRATGTKNTAGCTQAVLTSHCAHGCGGKGERLGTRPPPHCPKPSSRVGLSWGAALCARPGGNHTPHAHGLCAHPGAALAIPVAAQPRGLPKPGDRLCLPRPPAHSQANAVWNRAFIWVAHSGPCSRTLFPTTSTPPSPPTHPLLPSRGGCSRFFPARSSSRSSASAVPRPRTSTAAAAPAPGGGRAGG